MSPPSDYTAVIGVWVYGFFVLALILVDSLYYAAVHSELCREYLVNWGMGGPWLTQVNRKLKVVQLKYVVVALSIYRKALK